MLLHHDITSKKEEVHDLVQITEASLALLDLIFPRHIIEYMTREASAATQATHQRLSLGQSLATAVVSPPEATLCHRATNDFRQLTTHHEQVSQGQWGGLGQRLGISPPTTSR